MANARVGFGYDVHRLVEDRDLWLGGIKIPHYKGAIGHSDADVLIHAVCDALLGAAALGDIGTHFPDTSAEFKDIDSKILLGKVVALLEKNGFRIINIDSTVVLQRPKLISVIPEMRKVLSGITKTKIENFSVKAKTTESIGFTGREEGVAAYAVTLIEKI